MTLRTYLKNGLIAVAAIAASIGYFRHQSYQSTSPVVSQFTVPKVLPGVNTIIQQNSITPEVIFIQQDHPTEFSRRKAKSPESIEKICMTLHDQGVRSILLEGLNETHKNGYATSGEMRVTEIDRNLQNHADRQCKILNSKKWNLYTSESLQLHQQQETEEKEMNALIASAHAKARIAFPLRLQTYTTIKNRKVFVTSSQIEQFQSNYKALCDEMQSEYQPTLDALLTSEKVERIRALMVDAREYAIINQVDACRKDKQLPLIVIFGAAHTKSFLEKLEKTNHTYIALKPQGLPDRYVQEVTEEVVRKMFRNALKNAIAVPKPPVLQE